MMKLKIQLSVMLLCCIMVNACKDSKTIDEKTVDVKTGSDSATVVTTEKVDYPYTIENPDYWESGSQQNTLAVLNSLKAWENKNIDESLKYFADSIDVGFDGLTKKISNDSLRRIITPDSLTTFRIRMQDWESVISKDKKVEYVTVWYRQFYDNGKGKKDSVDVVNDLKMKDGKIIGIDEYERKLHM